MKIQIASDLHLSHWTARLKKSRRETLDLLVPRTDADVLVLAGDLTHGGFCIEVGRLLTELRPHQLVTWVPGNHDLYGERMTDCGFSGGVVRSLPRRFVGHTLWHDDTETARRLADHWSDSCIIGWKENVAAANAEAKRFLLSELKQGDILVTHFLPTWRSVQGIRLNPRS